MAAELGGGVMFLSEQVLADQCALHVSRLESLSLIFYNIVKQPLFLFSFWLTTLVLVLVFFFLFVHLPLLNLRQVIHQLLNPIQP